LDTIDFDVEDDIAVAAESWREVFARAPDQRSDKLLELVIVLPRPAAALLLHLSPNYRRAARLMLHRAPSRRLAGSRPNPRTMLDAGVVFSDAGHVDRGCLRRDIEPSAWPCFGSKLHS
jgi:hypothetical protein